MWYDVLVWSELADMPSHPLADVKLSDVTSHLDIGGEQTIGQQTFAPCRQKRIVLIRRFIQASAY